MMRRADHDRNAYIQRYFHRDWRSELLYDVQINTGALAIEDCVSTLVDLVERLKGSEIVGSIPRAQQ
jgi:hypothetical protein